jgi:hypothetical protein
MTRRFATRPALATAALLSVLLTLPLAGCGVDSSRVLARVGKRTITIDDFVEAARDKESQYPGTPDSAKSLLLDDLVRAALVLSDAQRLGLYREPAIAGARGPIENEEAQLALFRRFVPVDVPVSEAEVEQLYAWRANAAHVRAILCPSRGAANAAAAELARGARFEDIADRYSTAGGLPPGGDLGFLLPGALVPPLDRYLREGPLRTVIGPLESPDEGWFLLEVLERRERSQRPLDQQRLILRDMLRQRKVRSLRLRAKQTLREAYDTRLEPGGAQAVFAYFNQAVGDSSGRDLANPSPAQRAIVLARYRANGADSVYTLGDAILDLGDYAREKPNVAMIPAIEAWVDAQVIRRVALIEARRRRLNEDPEIVRKIDRRVDSQVLDLYFDTEIAHGVEAGPDDLREAYQRNLASFQHLDSVELLVATLADSAAAAHVAAHGSHAPSLREAVEMAAPGSPVTAESVRFPGAPERWKPYQQAFTEAAPPACVGPIRMRGEWVVAQVVSKVQESQALEHLPPATQQSLHQQAEDIAHNRAFVRKVESLRQEFQPEEHRERLKAIPWPVSQTGAAPRG